MNLARRRWPGEPRGMLSMDDMLHVPFDQLWSHAAEGMSRAGTHHEHLPPMNPNGPTGQLHLEVPQVDTHSMHWDMGSPIYAGEELLRREMQMRGPPSWVAWEQSHSVPEHEYSELAELAEDRVLRGVKPKVLRKQKTRTATSEDCDRCCNICMDAFRPGRRLMALPCGHPFCKDCICQWLDGHDTCPVCRWKFPEAHTRLINVDADEIR